MPPVRVAGRTVARDEMVLCDMVGDGTSSGRPKNNSGNPAWKVEKKPVYELDD